MHSITSICRSLKYRFAKITFTLSYYHDQICPNQELTPLAIIQENHSSVTTQTNLTMNLTYHLPGLIKKKTHKISSNDK